MADLVGHSEGLSRDQALAWVEERLAQLPAKLGAPLAQVIPEPFSEASFPTTNTTVACPFANARLSV